MNYFEKIGNISNQYHLYHLSTFLNLAYDFYRKFIKFLTLSVYTFSIHRFFDRTNLLYWIICFLDSTNFERSSYLIVEIKRKIFSLIL